MSVTSFLFYVLASLTGLCAIAVVVTQNIVRAAAWLLFALAGTSGIFFLLGADFVGATQLLVYVGGTLVLVVFDVDKQLRRDRKSTRLNSCHANISYAVFCLKKNKLTTMSEDTLRSCIA